MADSINVKDFVPEVKAVYDKLSKKQKIQFRQVYASTKIETFNKAGSGILTLTSLFNFDKTKQGFEYWWRIYVSLEGR